MELSDRELETVVAGVKKKLGLLAGLLGGGDAFSPVSAPAAAAPAAPAASCPTC